MTARKPIQLEPTEEQRERIHAAARALGTSYAEFCLVAVMQSADEVLTTLAEAEKSFDRIQAERITDAEDLLVLLDPVHKTPRYPEGWL